jgi:hypothetical protein
MQGYIASASLAMPLLLLLQLLLAVQHTSAASSFFNVLMLFWKYPQRRP